MDDRRRLLTGAAGVATGAMVVVGLALTHDEGAGRGEATARAAVTEYVRALNERDGAAVCLVMAPEVARTIVRLPRIGVPSADRGDVLRRRGCAAVLSEAIDRPQDLAVDEEATLWSRATVRRLRMGPERDGLRAADLRIFHRFDSNSSFATETDGERSDRLWLERRYGRWVVAGTGLLLSVATGVGSAVWALEPPAPPDATQRSARLPASPASCAGGARTARRHEIADRDGPQLDPDLDLRSVEVRRPGGGDVCVIVELGRPLGASAEVGVMTEHYEGAFGPRDFRPQRTPARFLTCGTSALRVDSRGRVTHLEERFVGGGRETWPPGVRAGGRGRTLTFLVPALDGERLRRLRFAVYADSHRRAAPERARAADAFPDRGRFLQDAAGASPKPSGCAQDVVERTRTVDPFGDPR